MDLLHSAKEKSQLVCNLLRKEKHGFTKRAPFHCFSFPIHIILITNFKYSVILSHVCKAQSNKQCLLSVDI